MKDKPQNSVRAILCYAHPYCTCKRGSKENAIPSSLLRPLFNCNVFFSCRIYSCISHKAYSNSEKWRDWELPRQGRPATLLSSMNKVPAIFRCPMADYREIKSICDENHMDISRFVLASLLMLVDECEAEGIIPFCPDPIYTKRIETRGKWRRKRSESKEGDA